MFKCLFQLQCHTTDKLVGWREIGKLNRFPGPSSSSAFVPCLSPCPFFQYIAVPCLSKPLLQHFCTLPFSLCPLWLLLLIKKCRLWRERVKVVESPPLSISVSCLQIQITMRWASLSSLPSESGLQWLPLTAGKTEFHSQSQNNKQRSNPRTPSFRQTAV